MKNTCSVSDFDVVIVGLGPIGATLANLLGLCGMRTLILEREAVSYHLPRAVHFDDECMRVFQTIGLAEKILPRVRLNPGMLFVDSDDRLILDWSRPQTLTPMGWNLSYRFHQPELEEILVGGLGRWTNVVVRNRCEVFALDQNDHCVRVRYEDLSSGQLVEISALFLIGCDGARSLIRRFIGSEMEDMGFHERWLVTDLLLKRDRSDLGDYSIQYCDPLRPATYIRGTGNRRRWEITVHPDEDSNSLAKPAKVWELLSRWITPDDAEIERAAVYTFHSVIAKEWRNGRLLIAGDSAHQTPPFLGQGMCAGIRDVANLAWKLCSVIRGKAEPNLLDTYQSERAPNVRHFIELAILLGGVINTKAVEAGLAAGESQDNAPAKMETRKPPIGPGLSVGSSPLIGHLAPQFTLANGRRSDDQSGYASVFLTESAAILSSAARTALDLAGVVVLDRGDAPDLGRWLKEHNIRAALIRPDRYIRSVASSLTDVDLVAETSTRPSSSEVAFYQAAKA